MKWLYYDGRDQTKTKTLERSCTLNDILLTASVLNVIEVFFFGLKNSVSAIALKIKYNTYIKKTTPNNTSKVTKEQESIF